MKIKDIISSLKKLGPNVEVTNIKGTYTYSDYDSDSDPDDYDDESDNKPKMTGVEVTPSTPDDDEVDSDNGDETIFNKLNELAGKSRKLR